MSWVNIKDNPYYSINENGIVKRNEHIYVDTMNRKVKRKEIILKQHIDKDGYKRVTLCTGYKKPKYCLLHRLLAETFIPNPNNYPVVNHKDENPLNNSLDNLEWCTVAYNNNYGGRQERVRKTQGKKIIGTNGEKTLIFNSANEASLYITGKKSSNISQCANGKFKQCYGYNWRWA